MVKLFCDRCNTEITDKYTTFNFWEYDINTQYNHCGAAESASSYNRTSALHELNSQPMYCQYCKVDVLAFIGRKVVRDT